MYRYSSSPAASRCCVRASSHHSPGIRLAREAGIKVGVRSTLTQDNAHDLPALLRLLEEESIDKFYLSHLNSAGRGNNNRAREALIDTTGRMMGLVFDACGD